ncbi:MAG: TIGR00730 family Rossman fold protein [Anaerolineales bacterium]
MEMERICVYCGSSDRVNTRYLGAAGAMGQALALRGISIIYGGGSTGMMGALANAALAAGGKVIGVLPRFFDTPELAHNKLTELHHVDSMHERKGMMAELADGFIALPGGFGTFEELFEILTWAQIGLHTSPVGILNIDGYFDPMMALVDHAQQQGFIYAEHKDLLSVDGDPDRLLDTMKQYQVPEGLERWVERGKDAT